MRLAMSLGMLLGMTHGLIAVETPAMAGSWWSEVVETVNSDTDFSPFGSAGPQEFPY